MRDKWAWAKINARMHGFHPTTFRLTVLTHLIMETRILVCTHRSMQTSPSLDSRLLEDAEEVYRRQGDPDASGAVSEADISLEMPESTCSLWHNV